MFARDKWRSGTFHGLVSQVTIAGQQYSTYIIIVVKQYPPGATILCLPILSPEKLGGLGGSLLLQVQACVQDKHGESAGC